MRFRELYYLNKHDRQVALILLALAAIALTLVFLVGNGEQDRRSDRKDSLRSSYQSSYSQRPAKAPVYYQQPERVAERFPFDPNTADSTQLLRLGLQPWQVRNIYKYRAAGGIYRKKEDFARLYGLTVKQYRELEPYIQISSDYLPASTLVEPEKPYERDTLKYPVKIQEDEQVNLNVMDTTVYRRVPGIGSYYARKIMDYGRRLGGYVSVDQLDEIEDFPQEAKKFFALGTQQTQRLNINQLSLNELKRHPYINYYQAKAIIDYRRQNGPIRDLNDLRLLDDFTEEAIRRLQPYVSY